ncbi:MAG: ATP-binding protein [Bryobacteraceae bacterium]|nr:ATP-binding protein [Bryobacteraceae bacterium]
MIRPGITGKLVIALTTLVILAGVVGGTISLRSQERHLLNTMILGADQLSNGITRATWESMLMDHRQSAYEVMRSIARTEGIDHIRMFNREGTMMFSTREVETERRVTKDAAACVVCHAGGAAPRDRLDAPSRVRVSTAEDGRRRLMMVTPIYNEPSCSQAACHAHPGNMKVLGVLDVTFHLDYVDRELTAARTRISLVFGAMIALINVFIFFFTRRFVAQPIRRLMGATKRVSEMNLEQPLVWGEGDDELGQLARSFEGMRVRLRGALGELNELAQNLERKVVERTEQLKAANQKLVQTDRLASLGQLSASVAHEINNPLSGVLNLSMLLQRILKDDGIPKERIPEFRKYLGQISSETSRAGRIVSDLLAFSRRSKPQRAEADLNRIVRTTLSLVDHKLRMADVCLELALDERLPHVWCDSSQMQQVVLNLVMNAAEAMHERKGGRIEVVTRCADGQVVLEVRDNGEGIPQEQMAKIFDPFFTTKPEGKGVGLGLAVVYGIVQAHSGDIDVKSEVGRGTTFAVWLPLAAADAAEGRQAAAPAGR